MTSRSLVRIAWLANAACCSVLAFACGSVNGNKVNIVDSDAGSGGNSGSSAGNSGSSAGNSGSSAGNSGSSAGNGGNGSSSAGSGGKTSSSGGSSPEGGGPGGASPTAGASGSSAGGTGGQSTGASGGGGTGATGGGTLNGCNNVVQQGALVTPTGPNPPSATMPAQKRGTLIAGTYTLSSEVSYAGPVNAPFKSTAVVTVTGLTGTVNLLGATGSSTDSFTLTVAMPSDSSQSPVVEATCSTNMTNVPTGIELVVDYTAAATSFTVTYFGAVLDVYTKIP